MVGSYQSENSSSRIKILKLLNRLKVNTLDIPSKFNKETPLHLGVQCKQFEDIEFLIKNGADIHFKNIDGKSSLHFAHENGIIEEFLKIYLKYDGNLHAEDDFGFTIMGIAILYNSLPIVNFILEHG